jgi:hypothetical protein
MCGLDYWFGSWRWRKWGQLAVGTPEQIMKDKKSITGHYLKDKL